MNRKQAFDAGKRDGIEHVETVLREQGREAVIATLKPGHLGWDEDAINNAAHKYSGVPEAHRGVYYRAYATAARNRAERIARTSETTN